MTFAVPDSLPPRRGHALVVDDHPLVLRGITEFLMSHPLLDGAVGVGSAREALVSVVNRGAPSIALVDFWMADGASTAFLADLRAIAPATRILTMSGDGHASVRQHARSSGAHGFVHKQQPPEVFAQAISAVLGGGGWFDGAEGALLAPDPSREVPVTPGQLGLTARQGEILALVLAGQPNKRIATTLGLSESTVKEHVTGILQRLDVTTRIEAIARLRGMRIELPPVRR